MKTDGKIVWKCYLPAFFKWSSIMTDEIMKTFPMLPTTDKHASTSKRAILDHSVDSVMGEKSFIWCLLLEPGLFMLCNVRYDMDETISGIVNVVAVVEMDVGAAIGIVAAGNGPKLLLLSKNAAIVDTSILSGLFVAAGKKNNVYIVNFQYCHFNHFYEIKWGLKTCCSNAFRLNYND